MDQHQQQQASPHGMLGPMYPSSSNTGFAHQQPTYSTHTQLPPVRQNIPSLMQLPRPEENSYNGGYVSHPPSQSAYYTGPLPPMSPIERHNDQMMAQSYFGAQAVTLPIRVSGSMDYGLQHSRQQRHSFYEQEAMDTRHGRHTLRCPDRLWAPHDNASQLPSESDFYDILNDYIISLSPKKRDKALIPMARYDNIMRVLQDPKCTTIESAQFRFWSKKMFVLASHRDRPVVTHEGKPVAVKEDLYIVLTNAHLQAQHGGRDKTSTQVRKQFSWVPKELIARFVKACPQCKLRRSNPSSSRQMRRKSSSPYSRSKSPPPERDQQARSQYQLQSLQRPDYGPQDNQYSRQCSYNAYACSQPPTPMAYDDHEHEQNSPSPPCVRSSEPLTPEAFPSHHMPLEYRGGSADMYSIPYHQSSQVSVANMYSEPVNFQNYASPFSGIKQERMM